MSGPPSTRWLSNGRDSAAVEIRAVLTALSTTPKQIVRLTRGSDDRRLHRKPAADAWSVHEIVAHLRVCADVWGRSIERMLNEEHPTIRYVSPRGWIRKTDYLHQDFHDSLRVFANQRVTLVKALRGLDSIDWSRGATFTGTTLGREATVMGYARRIADHEAQHLGQIRRTIQT
ncbi:MAG: DinB family protein [Gemmatimonadales bacterium]